MDASDTDVVIVGAGPVGLSLALALDVRGTRVRVVDSNAAPASTARTLVVWARTLEHFDALGLDTSRLTKDAIGVHGARVFSHDGTSARELVDVPFDGAESAHGMGAFVPQSVTEQFLLEACATRGIEVMHGRTLKSSFDRGDSTESVVSGAHGDEIMRASYTIGCDGARSTVRHGMGVQFEGETIDDRFVLADVLLDFGDDGGREAIRVIWHPDGVVAFLPVTRGVWRIIARTAPPTTDAREVSFSEILEILQRRANGVIPASALPTSALWLSEFHVNERVASTFHEGRIFLAGDAAHIHSPVGGQGMNAGIADAMNLAWKLDLVRQGMADAALLESYESERRPAIDRIIRATGFALRAATGRPKILAKIRNAIVPVLLSSTHVQSRLVAGLSQLSLSYAKGPLARKGGRAGKVRAGSRFPNLIATDDAGTVRPLQRELTYTRFLALGWEDATSPGGAFSATQSLLTALPERLRAQTRSALLTSCPRIAGGMEMFFDASGAAVRALGGGSGSMLVRPDGYIAAVAQNGDPHDIARFLRAASF